MKADCNELNDDLLPKVQGDPSEDGDDDLVHCHFPGFNLGILIQVMVYHDRKEGYQYSEHPEKERGRNLELLAHVPPFLAVVGKYARDEACRPWQRLGHNSCSPEGEPDYLEPNAEPKQEDSAHCGSVEYQTADEQGNEDDQHQRYDIHEISDQPIGIVNPLECPGKIPIGVLWRFEGGRLLMYGICIDVELVDRFRPGP